MAQINDVTPEHLGFPSNSELPIKKYADAFESRWGTFYNNSADNNTASERVDALVRVLASPEVLVAIGDAIQSHNSQLVRRRIA